jgi:chromosome segregation ATPase
MKTKSYAQTPKEYLSDVSYESLLLYLCWRGLTSKKNIEEVLSEKKASIPKLETKIAEYESLIQEKEHEIKDIESKLLEAQRKVGYYKEKQQNIKENLWIAKQDLVMLPYYLENNYHEAASIYKESIFKTPGALPTYEKEHKDKETIEEEE